MIKGKLTHPEILSILGKAGHGSKILIADGNYPFSTGSLPTTPKVYLNLSPGLVTVTQVLETLLDAIEIEAAEVMVPDNGSRPPIFAEFEKLLPNTLKLIDRERFEFYGLVKSSDTALVVATGEQRIFANLLLTIGVRLP
ncbi:MAG: RbsD or FucU transport [Promethearchaeota archaeon]|nr:MAG: RbsD or FucU transport [Candidatus Lokiarchaeota archaeon]